MPKKSSRSKRRALKDAQRRVVSSSNGADSSTALSPAQKPTPPELEELRAENEKLHAELAKLSGDITRLSSAFEKRLEARSKTIATKVGEAFIAVYQSPLALLKLPGRLWRIHREAFEASPEKPSGQRHAKALAVEKLLAPYEHGGLPQLQSLFEEKHLAPAARERSLLDLAKHYQKLDQPGRAAALGRAAYDINPQPALAKWIAFRLFDAGQVAEPLALLEGPAAAAALSDSETKRSFEIKALANLLKEPPTVPTKAVGPFYDPVDGSLLYVAASCLPYHNSGYTNRTHELNLALKAAGGKVTIVTRPGYPWDRPNSTGLPSAMSTSYEGLEYRHIRTPSSALPLDIYLREAAVELAKVATAQKVAAIYAASNHVNALPALLAARQLGLPFVYKMRGLWDLSRAAKIGEYEDSDRYRLAMQLEALVAKEADRVFVISEALGRYIEKEWGIDPAKIEILPNCVNPETIERAKKAAGPKPDVFTVGYAGALVAYEGLDLLIDAMVDLKRSGTTVHARIIGDGPEREKLQERAKSSGLNGQVQFLGRLTPDEARAKLAETHVAVLPRRPDAVCRLIPPLKLAECRGLGLRILAPDLDLLSAELDACEHSDLFAAGDANSLACQLVSLASNRAESAEHKLPADRFWHHHAEGLLAHARVNANGALDGKMPSSRGASASRNSPKKADSLGQLDGALSLGETPFWREITTGQGSELRLEYSLDISPADPRTANKSVVMLVQFFNNEKTRVEPSETRLPWSNRLKSRFCYLKPTNRGKPPTRIQFPVPNSVEVIRLGFRTFEVSSGSEVTIHHLAVDVLESNFPSFKASELMAKDWPIELAPDKPQVLAVMDEFTAECLDKDVCLVLPRPDNWLALARQTKPSLAFIESAWKGNEGTWQYRVGSYSYMPGGELQQLCAHARSLCMPTIFWNKEDPVHHTKFLRAASFADHIFTTDARLLDSYTKATGNKSVHALPFAAAPSLHFPAPIEMREKKCCFAGSWYGNRHEKRAASMSWLLTTARQHGLDIYDRNSGAAAEFSFPSEFAECTKPRVAYRKLCGLYRKYRVFLNVNSVDDSPSMFSRRVFELLACGTPVVSTYALGIEEILGTEAVWLVRNKSEADEAIAMLLSDDAEWCRRSRAGIRQVFSAHTYAHRLDEVFRIAGASDRVMRHPFVLLISRVSNEADLGRLHDFVQRQSYSNFRIIGLVRKNSRLLRRGTQPAANIQLILKSSLDSAMGTFDAVGLLDARLGYGIYYLRDLVNAMQYQPDAGGWAKALQRDAYAYDQPWTASACILKPDVFARLRPLLLGERIDTLFGHGIYSIDASELGDAHTSANIPK